MSRTARSALSVQDRVCVVDLVVVDVWVMADGALGRQVKVDSGSSLFCGACKQPSHPMEQTWKGCGNQGVSCCRGEGDRRRRGRCNAGNCGNQRGQMEVKKSTSTRGQNGTLNGTREVTMERAPWGRLDPAPFTWMVDGDLRQVSRAQGEEG